MVGDYDLFQNNEAKNMYENIMKGFDIGELVRRIDANLNYPETPTTNASPEILRPAWAARFQGKPFPYVAVSPEARANSRRLYLEALAAVPEGPTRDIIKKVCRGRHQVNWAVNLLRGRSVSPENSYKNIFWKHTSSRSLDGLAGRFRKQGVRVKKSSCNIVGLENYDCYKITYCPRKYRFYEPAESETL